MDNDISNLFTHIFREGLSHVVGKQFGGLILLLCIYLRIWKKRGANLFMDSQQKALKKNGKRKIQKEQKTWIWNDLNNRRLNNFMKGEQCKIIWFNIFVLSHQQPLLKDVWEMWKTMFSAMRLTLIRNPDHAIISLWEQLKRAPFYKYTSKENK